VAPRHSLSVLAFDAYGTLFDVMSVTARCERHFPGHGASLAGRWRAKQLQYTWLRSLMGRYADFWSVTGDALDHAAASLELNLTPACRRDLMDAYLALDLFPDVGPGLDALRQQGLRLAILSNGSPAMLDAAVRHAGLAGVFAAIVSADEAGIFKPSPAVYGRLLERLSIGADAVGFVSSNSWDVGGAASAGLTTFWLRRHAGEPPDELGWAAAHIVPTIESLAGAGDFEQA
jgi:2-haloacid dehalogenase